MFLAIDSVFDQCSVAIVSQELTVLSCHTKTGKREQTQQILPMVDAALREANIKLSDLTALIFNRGPGPFSGIRINTAVVQALAVAHDLPCVGVSSLAVVAHASFESYGFDHVYAAIDARMKQVYFGEYQLSQSTPKVMLKVEGSEECLLDYELTTEQSLPIVGNGAELLTPLADQKRVTDLNLTASVLAKVGIAQYLEKGGVPAEQALPVYLRNNTWKTLKEQGKA